MQANPELWDDLQGIHVKEMVEAYIVSYNTNSFITFLSTIKDEKVKEVF